MSDVNVANGQCDYPFKANIETTGQFCILLGAEYYVSIHLLRSELVRGSYRHRLTTCQVVGTLLISKQGEIDHVSGGSDPDPD